MPLLRNAVDTWTNQAANTKNYGDGARLWVGSVTSNIRYSWLFFSRPWPPGSLIISAKLRLYSGSTVGTSTTFTVQRAASKWGVNRVTYTNQPTVVAGSATKVMATLAPGTEVEIDVTTLVQGVADGGAWYGFRVASSQTAASHWVHSTQGLIGDYRPVLEVTWSLPPEAPENLSPAGGRAVSIAKPVIRSEFRDPDGQDTMNAMRVWFSATKSTVTADADTGAVTTDIPEVDLSTVAAINAWAGIGLTTTSYRVCVQDSNNQWSDWSTWADVIRVAKGTLTMTAPSSGSPVFTDGSPTITWSLAGATQRAYQVVISRADRPNDWIWDSGKLTGTATSASVPFGTIVDSSLTYRVRLRVWDTVDRESTPTDPAMYEITRDVTFSYSAGTAPVVSFSGTADPDKPEMDFTWTRSAPPDHYQLQRSEDGGTTWNYIAEWTGAELSTGGTNYAASDRTAAPYINYQWRMLAVVAGVQSASNPTYSGSIRRLAPTLMRKDGSDHIIIANPARSKQFLDIQGIHEVMGAAPPVVVSQKLGGNGGTVSGRLAPEIQPSLTAQQLKARFKGIRRDAGMTMILSIADEQIYIVPYNMQIDTVTDTTGITYQVSFDYVEVDK